MKHRLLYNQRSPLVVRRENAALTHEAENKMVITSVSKTLSAKNKIEKPRNADGDVQ